MSYLSNAVQLLLGFAFDIVIAVLLLRLLAEAWRAEFRNPLSQFLYRYTNPLLAPVRRVLPNWRRINLAALLVCYLLMLLKRLVLFALVGVLPGLAGLLVLALADLLDFSPAVVMIGLLLARILVAAPLFDWGTQLARGF
jgi:YggT family protein